MALLGSAKYPALVRVKTVGEAAELLPSVHALGAAVVLVVDAHQAEDRSQYSLLVSPWASKPSGKLGGNDPCPCGSGKKYKGCCLRQVEDVNVLGRRAEAPAGMPEGVKLARSVSDRRPTERGQAQVHRAIATQEFDSLDEVNAFVERHRKANTLSRFAPETLTAKAQELVYDAWEAKTAKKRVSLAEKALSIEPDCADAYVVLAEEQALAPEATLALYQKAVEAAVRALGPEHLKGATGHFWSDMETRPYMRARAGLAKTLWALERREEAVEQLKELLRLNPGDHQGLRYWLGPWLVAQGRSHEALPLLRAFAPDWRVDWIFLAALVTFSLEGQSPFAVRLLAEGLAENARVPDLLLGRKKVPKGLPELVAAGEENEALACAMLQREAWSAVPGALDWLKGAQG